MAYELVHLINSEAFINIFNHYAAISFNAKYSTNRYCSSLLYIQNVSFWS